MIRKIDHIAIAVQNLESALETFMNVLGCAPGDITIEEVPSEKVRVAFIPVGDTKIELLQPLSDDSPISKFLQKTGTACTISHCRQTISKRRRHGSLR